MNPFEPPRDTQLQRIETPVERRVNPFVILIVLLTTLVFVAFVADVLFQ